MKSICVRISNLSVLALAGLLAMLSTALLAQTITTGQLSGTVTDPSGAVVANAAVLLKSLAGC